MITTLTGELKQRANNITFDICAEFVANEVANMLRKTINRYEK